MDIHRVGSPIPVSDVPTESVAPHEASLPPTISQPFQNDALVSYTPGLDLGSSPAGGQTPPPGGQDDQLGGGSLQDPSQQQQDLIEEFRRRVISNVLEAKRNSAEDVINKIR